MNSKIKKQVFKEIKAKSATNRIIREVFSAKTKEAKGVTVRIVDIHPASRQIPRQPHRHDDFEEVIHILKGSGKFWADGEWTNINTGDTLLVPTGVPHATFNLTDKMLRLMCFFPVAAGVDKQVLINLKIRLDDQNESN